MAIYFMHGKTFLKNFINEDPVKVLRTQFVLVSARLRKSGKYKQVITAGNYLFPNNTILSNLAASEGTKYDIDDFLQEYRDQLKDNLPMFATLVKGAIEDKYTIVFLCGYSERKLKYLKELARFIEDEFRYPVYDYKKYKKGKEKKKEYKKSECLERANKILAKAQKQKYKNDMESSKGREEILKNMDKKQMKKKLKSMNLFYPGMKKSDMKDSLNVFFVNS
jgi:predicted RND superfamily exporter protein